LFEYDWKLEHQFTPFVHPFQDNIYEKMKRSGLHWGKCFYPFTSFQRKTTVTVKLYTI